MTLYDAFLEFVIDRKSQALTFKTLEFYENTLRVFIKYLGRETDISTITHRKIKDYAIELQSRNLSKATVASYLRSVKVFLRWVHGEYSLSFDPARIRVPKSPKKKVHIYSDREIYQIFDLIRASVPWITARNRAMVALMLDSGIRQSEVCGLLREFVDTSSGLMKVYGKGDKERYVPVGTFALRFLDDYLAQCPYQSEYVFLSIDGRPITANTVRQFTYKLQKKLPFEFSSHRLRHNFATNYCLDSLAERKTTGVYDLSIIMGHTSIETTKRYEHLAHELIAANSCISHLDKVYAEKR